MIYYGFDSNNMVQDLCADALNNDDKKKLKHGAIIVNNCSEINQQSIEQLTNIIQWMALSDMNQITIFDKEGHMMNKLE